MQGLLTYTAKAAARGLALLLATLLACGLVPAEALARTAAAEFGIALEVPASAFVDPGDGSGVRAADALVGIRVEVPASAFVGPGDGADVRSADSLMGIRIEVPTQSYVDPDDGTDVRATEGLMGIRLEVPTGSFVDPGDGSDVRAAEGLFGIRLEVPKQAFVDPDDGDDVRSTGALVGMRLAVPSQAFVEPGDGEDVKATAALTGIRLMVTSDKADDGYDMRRFFLHMAGEGASLVDAEGYALDASDPADAIYTGRYRLTEGKMLPTPVRPGYDFAGWYADASYAGDSVAGVSRDEEGNPHFWAKWEEDASPEERYTVTFDTRRGSSVAAQEVDKGGVATRPADPVRQGFAFAGWYADAACGVPFDFDAPIVADTTVYAGWEKRSGPIGAKHEVTFDAMGGTKVASQTVVDGGHARRPATDPTRDGWRFAGWYADAEGALALDEARLYDFAGTPVTADATVYAGWRELERFAVTFYAAGGAFENAGEGGVDVGEYSIEVLEGSRVPASQVPGEPGCPAAAPKWAGWQFAGWYPEARDEAGAGTGQGDYAGGEFDFEGTPVEGPTNVFAKWTLRLDVTVPASIGLAVDAGTGRVTAPAMGEYALKSRTVRPVEVQALALRSEQSELEGFFELPEGALPDGAPEAERLAAWRDALSATRLTLLADAPGAAPIGLPLAGDADGSAWRSAYALAEAERAAYRIAAFSYAGTAFDELWQGAGPSERLPLELGMSIPTDKLEVRTDLGGERPVTRLQITVAARE